MTNTNKWTAACTTVGSYLPRGASTSSPQRLVNFPLDNTQRGQLYGEGEMIFMFFISSPFSNSQSIVYSLDNSATSTAHWRTHHPRSQISSSMPPPSAPAAAGKLVGDVQGEGEMMLDVDGFYSQHLILIVDSHLFLYSATINFGGSMWCVTICSTNQR